MDTNPSAETDQIELDLGEAFRKVEQASVTTAHPVDVAVEAWLEAHVRNTPISRNTEAWNHLMGAIPALKTALKKEL